LPGDGGVRARPELHHPGVATDARGDVWV